MGDKITLYMVGIIERIQVSWIKGLFGTFPVFDNKEDAEKYAKGELSIYEFEVDSTMLKDNNC